MFDCSVPFRRCKMKERKHAREKEKESAFMMNEILTFKGSQIVERHTRDDAELLMNTSCCLIDQHEELVL